MTTKIIRPCNDKNISTTQTKAHVFREAQGFSLPKTFLAKTRALGFETTFKELAQAANDQMSQDMSKPTRVGLLNLFFFVSLPVTKCYKQIWHQKPNGVILSHPWSALDTVKEHFDIQFIYTITYNISIYILMFTLVVVPSKSRWRILIPAKKMGPPKLHSSCCLMRSWVSLCFTRRDRMRGFSEASSNLSERTPNNCEWGVQRILEVQSDPGRGHRESDIIAKVFEVSIKTQNTCCHTLLESFLWHWTIGMVRMWSPVCFGISASFLNITWNPYLSPIPTFLVRLYHDYNLNPLKIIISQTHTNTFPNPKHRPPEAFKALECEPSGCSRVKGKVTRSFRACIATSKPSFSLSNGADVTKSH